LEEYLKKDFAKSNGSKALIVKEKLSVQSALNILRGLKIANSNSVISTGSKTISNDEITLLHQKFDGQVSQNWRKEDIRFANAVFVTSNEDSIRLYKRKISEDYNRIFVYYMSEPVFTSDNNHLFFRCIKSRNFSSTVEDFVVIFKREKRGWNLVEKILSSDLN